MTSALVIPGVQVRTLFEPEPVASGVTGVLGVVGVADRGPVEPTPVGTFTEFLETFGPGSRYTMPEVRSALTNGVSRVVVARTAAGRGKKAVLDLVDDDGEQVVRLEARAEGVWGERISVRVLPVRTLSGAGVKYVNLELSYDGEVVETLDNLIMDDTSPNYLFTRVNEGSKLVTAIDPLFERQLPGEVADTPLAEADSRAAFATLASGAATVLRAEAKRAGRAGNRLAVAVTDGRAGRTLSAGAVPSVDIRARAAGTAGTDIKVAVQSGPTLSVVPAAGSPRSYPFTSVADLVTKLAADPEVTATAIGDNPPAPDVLAAASLERRIDVTVHAEGRDPQRFQDLATLDAVAAIQNPLVQFTKVGAATALPGSNNGVALAAGRDKGRALALPAEPDEPPVLELLPARDVTVPLSVRVVAGVSTVDGATPVADLVISSDGTVVETHGGLTMDPDDPFYLPEVLESSAYLRARDLFVPSRTTSLPAAVVRPKKLTGSLAVSADDYQSALDRLESADEVDLVIASAANQLAAADVRLVQQQVIAHCTKMADVARNRIGLGSIAAADDGDASAILDHADDVRSDHFVLCAPAGAEGPVAGLLGRLSFFESPTFKTISALGVPPPAFTDATLERLVSGKVLVVDQRRGLGTIVIKGLLTSGRQISVQRTAGKVVRDVAAIARTYIGLLNNEGSRNALKQQVTAMLLQLQADGALVPSTDGTSPAFSVSVHSSQADFGNGIVRLDIAVRPVRSIDYLYASIAVLA